MIRRPPSSAAIYLAIVRSTVSVVLGVMLLSGCGSDTSGAGGTPGGVLTGALGGQSSTGSVTGGTTSGTGGTSSGVPPTQPFLIASVPLSASSTAFLAGIAIDPSLGKVYVSNTSDNNVVVVDSQTNTTLGVVPVALTPGPLTVDLMSHQVYVACQGIQGTNLSPALSIVDGITDRLLIDAYGAPLPIDLIVDAALNKIYVVNSVFGAMTAITVFNRLTLTVSATITAGNFSSSRRRIALDPVAHRLYVTNDVDNTVAVIDEFLDSVVQTIHVGKRATPVVVDPASHKVYVGNLGDGTISVIDGTTNSVIKTIPVDISVADMAISTTTHHIYAAAVTSNNVIVIDGTNDTVAATLPRTTGASVIAVDSIRNRLYLGNYGTSTLSIYDGSKL